MDRKDVSKGSMRIMEIFKRQQYVSGLIREHSKHKETN